MRESIYILYIPEWGLYGVLELEVARLTVVGDSHHVHVSVVEFFKIIHLFSVYKSAILSTHLYICNIHVFIILQYPHVYKSALSTCL